MYSTVLTGALQGVSAYPVCVEADVSGGLPAFLMVGSLSLETRESRERVMIALKNVGLDMPPCHITVNLSPGDRRKEGTAFDLPIAVAVLEAMGKIPKGAGRNILFLGELGLNGEIKETKGVLPIVRAAVSAGISQCIVPKRNVREGAVIPGIQVRGAENILEVIHFLSAEGTEREEILPSTTVDVAALFQEGALEGALDFSEIAGQEVAKRAAEIAAAGFHNLLMVGPPGAGKSMIAKRIGGILPPLTLEESLEVTGILSVAGLLKGEEALVTRRPFMSPHHTISQSALIGGSVIPKPGVISLAHRGVLFLDELPECQRKILDSLRQPLEEREVTISRVGGNVTYPSDFMLVCAMNPCPCGYYPDKNKCSCTENEVHRYLGKVSGPILDRIDLCVELHAVEYNSLQNQRRGEDSATIRARVEKARERQKERFRDDSYKFNGDMDAASMEKYCKLGAAEKKCMEQLYESFGLSARAYHRILKVARTIADLAGCEDIKEEHLMEAAFYRPASEYWRG